MSLDNTAQSYAKDLVILIHGFGCKSFVMWPMAARLKKRGFRAHSWNYRSLYTPIDLHAERLYEFLTNELAYEQRIHIIAHSMGTIVTRAALNRGMIPNLGRVVFSRSAESWLADRADHGTDLRPLHQTGERTLQRAIELRQSNAAEQ